MLLFDGAFGLLLLGVWIFCIIDVITTPESECRNLPKIVWLLLVVILADIGSIAWLIAGRNWSGAASSAPRGAASRYPEYDRPGRHVPANPDDDEAFLAQLRARAEEQRRRAKEAQPREDEPPATS